MLDDIAPLAKKIFTRHFPRPLPLSHPRTPHQWQNALFPGALFRARSLCFHPKSLTPPSLSISSLPLLGPPDLSISYRCNPGRQKLARIDARNHPDRQFPATRARARAAVGVIIWQNTCAQPAENIYIYGFAQAWVRIRLRRILMILYWGSLFSWDGFQIFFGIFAVKGLLAWNCFFFVLFLYFFCIFVFLYFFFFFYDIFWTHIYI